ncbi:MAG: Holliday junction helicase RuvA [Clostridia bacterium]|jgi:Holliday junction DNA helicase RuvA|nr:Holliday junction helicase RuvA [Clostridia bacterium]
MITYLKGRVEEINENALVIEVYGIGYEVFCCSQQFYEQMESKASVTLYIYEHIKEDGHDLYGFRHKEERELFKKLTSVSGIGPKGGMQILNTYTSQEIISIILSADSKALNKVSGIGPKTAQRIILELKDSIGKMGLYGTELLQAVYLGTSTQKDDAIEALTALGYGAADAKKAVSAIFDDRDTSEQLIKKALSLLGL